MSMTLAEGQEELLGDKLYFFRSKKPGEKRCLIWAHGGLLSDDKEKTFTAPVMVRFVQAKHGEILKTNWTQFMYGGPNQYTDDVRPGNPLKNYALAKAVGSHWDKFTTDGTTWNTLTYQQVRVKMDANAQQHSNWTPHVVIIRNKFRFLGKMVVKLEDIIEAILLKDDTINDIIVSACRGEVGAFKSTFKYRQ